ncbi:hypothetical protein GQ607_016188 [Colletotrichum asianum]|uniref:Uncharacterized protein n=1 Tax=Colletotrichum asianum TaxID=702518 RepID=A0A8H3ZEG6_9PEZI|nr:hypothetical protein GQ607_016188 [Colletotrichum asianum]
MWWFSHRPRGGGSRKRSRKERIHVFHGPRGLSNRYGTNGAFWGYRNHTRTTSQERTRPPLSSWAVQQAIPFC